MKKTSCTNASMCFTLSRQIAAKCKAKSDRVSLLRDECWGILIALCNSLFNTAVSSSECQDY